MIEQHVDVPTTDGAVRTFVCHPERSGPHPVILFFMDAPGIREELRDMARRIASVGYYVMLPNMYYRDGVEELGSFIGQPDAMKKMFTHMAALNIPKVMSDTDALVKFADQDPAADAKRIGCVGYCMSGQYSINAAARHPDRVKSAASIYGVRLITDQPDSPHAVAPKGNAEIYVAWAETDHYAPLDELKPFEDALKASGVKAEVELYRGVEHGFAFPQRPAYDRPAAERHWERLFDLFGRTLQA